MTVGSRTFARAPDPADDLAADDLLPGLCLYPEHVSIQGFIAVAMVDDDVVPVAVASIAGYRDRSVSSGIDRSPLRGGEVKAGVEFSGLIHGVYPVSKP